MPNSSSSSAFSRGRLVMFVCVWLAVFVLLSVRLIDAQIVKGESYLQKAEGNRFFTLPLAPERGVFLDRFGETLVWNIPKYYKVENPEVLFEKPVAISREEALSTMASSASATVITETERQYRFPAGTAHVLGYVGDVTAEDIEATPTLRSDQKIGKVGLEKMFESVLEGKPGERIFEINALGEKQRLAKEVAPVAGENIRTTLDPALSEVAQRALGDRQGAVIITDAQNGELLAVVSSPAFDPNVLSQSFADPQKEAERKSLIQSFFTNPLNPFFNRSISGAYPPGSVFKMMTALAGLEAGKVDDTTTVTDDGSVQIGTYEFGNWYYSQYGRVEGAINVVQALTRSNDIFFYRLAEWTGPDGIAVVARNFGLGQKTGVEIPGEASGLVPDPAWKRDVKNEKWYLGDTYHYGIGQGDVLTTPMQIAQVTQALANHGSLCGLHVEMKDDSTCRDVGVKPENLQTVLRGMIGACSTRGTAFPFFPYNEKKLQPILDPESQITQGVVACKTGTAEFGVTDEKGYKKTHGWFTMMVGLPDLHNRPELEKRAFPKKITITVLVESDEKNVYREGSRDAAPVAKEIFDWIVK